MNLAVYLPEPDDQVEWEPVASPAAIRERRAAFYRSLERRPTEAFSQELLALRIRDALWYYHPPAQGRGMRRRRVRRHERR